MCDRCLALNAAVIVLMLYVLWVVMDLKTMVKERIGGNDALYTSGATMRILAQQFTQPGQGKRITVYNAERGPDGVPRQIDILATLAPPITGN